MQQQLDAMQGQVTAQIAEIERLSKENLVLKSKTEDDKEAYLVRITSAENEILKLQSKDDRGGGQRGWRGFVDLRHIQPEKFSGKEEFLFWIKKAKTCLESQLDGVGKCLDAAMKVKEDITEAKHEETILVADTGYGWGMVDKRLYFFRTHVHHRSCTYIRGNCKGIRTGSVEASLLRV